MYIVVIAWMYVAVMMTVAEATSSQGSLLGAIVTFVLYGLLPVALVVYLMGTPARRKARAAREAMEARQAGADPASGAITLDPDASREPAADPVATVRKEP